MEPLSLLLEDALATMREGEVCRLENLPREVVPDLPPSVSPSYTLTLLSFSRAIQVWEMEPCEALSLARRHKERGGQLYREGREREAAVCYSRAARLAVAGGTGEGEAGQLLVALRLNLAACQLRMGQASHASSNCSKVLEVEPQSVKALYRRGLAGLRVGDLEQAEQDLRLALAVEPGNTAVQRRLGEVAEMRYSQSVRLSHALRPMFGSSSSTSTSAKDS